MAKRRDRLLRMNRVRVQQLSSFVLPPLYEEEEARTITSAMMLEMFCVLTYPRHDVTGTESIPHKSKPQMT